MRFYVVEVSSPMWDHDGPVRYYFRAPQSAEAFAKWAEEYPGVSGAVTWGERTTILGRAKADLGGYDLTGEG